MSTVENITLLPGVILFQFTERVVEGKFLNGRSSGLVDDLGTDFLSYGGISRCARVVRVGSRVDECVAGDEIIVENLKWTPEFSLDGQSYWMTTNTHVLGIVKR